MNSRRRCLAGLGLASLLAALALLAQPTPPQAKANIACDAIGGAANTVTGGVNAITGGLLGTGNPVSGACNSATDGAVNAVTSPITGALKGIGNGIFDQITTWVSEGATWLIGQVVAEIEKTTTPKLTSEGFLAEYGQMAEIAAVLAAAMALLAVLEALAQGSWGVLAKAVLVNLPVAFIATSVAFAVVQLLLVATDGMCHAIAVTTQEHSKHFFHSAITSLGKAGGTAGGVIDNPGGIDPASGAAGHAAGSVEVPLFVTFLAAIIGGFAAFFVWIELIARDAAVYVVALFMPMALAASIWPRWSGALRRTGELLVVVIASKFVIVSIIALAAGLIAEGQSGVEHVLAASALMLLACFAPFMLLRLVPFAEGAMAAAYGRRSASGAALGGLQLASEVQIIRNMARSNWGAKPPEVWNLGSNGGGSGGGSGGGGSPRGGGGRGGGGAAGAARTGTSAAGGETAAGAGASAGAAAASPAAAAVSVPVAAAKSARSGAQRLEQTATAQAATGSGTSQGASQGGQAPGTSQPTSEPSGESAKPAAASPSEQPPRPPQELPAKGGAKGSK
jgi:DNA processing protein